MRTHRCRGASQLTSGSRWLLLSKTLRVAQRGGLTFFIGTAGWRGWGLQDSVRTGLSGLTASSRRLWVMAGRCLNQSGPPGYSSVLKNISQADPPACFAFGPQALVILASRSPTPSSQPPAPSLCRGGVTSIKNH